MTWVGHVALEGERRDAYRVLVGKFDIDCLEDLSVGWRIMLKLIFKK
jgi:hypothetical protein